MTYERIRLRNEPPPKSASPANVKTTVAGSGVVDWTTPDPDTPTFPVLPFPKISDANVKPPLFAVKLDTVTPVAEPTLNDSGPAGFPT